MVVWACVHLPHLALDGVLRHRAVPGPLVLADSLGTLLDVNDAARFAGLHPSQSLTAARALLADFSVVEHHPSDDDRQLRFLAAWAYRYSSEVALLDGAVVLEIGRSLGLFGPWARLRSRMREDLTALGFRHAIAVAPTPHAARVLAGYRDELHAGSQTELEQSLKRIPADAVRMPGDAGARLRGMGICTLGQLFSLPRQGLSRRFGKALPDWLDTVLGARSEPLSRYRPPDRFEQRLEFDYGVDRTEALAFPLNRLINDLSVYLSSRDGGVRRFEVGLEHEHHKPSLIPIGLRTAERDADVLSGLTREYLVRQQLPAPVCAMRLTARDLPPFVPASGDLFDRRAAEAVSLEQLRERLRARLGEDAVYRVYATVDPRPERATTRGLRIPTCSGGTRNSDPRTENCARPTWLLERPIPLRGPVPRILAGPERLETGWWDGADIRRDYYIVETSLGQRAWVFCPPGEPGCWMLHGWFA